MVNFDTILVDDNYWLADTLLVIDTLMVVTNIPPTVFCCILCEIIGPK